jgi:DNA-binding transcriptional ArsR family regulator
MGMRGEVGRFDFQQEKITELRLAKARLEDAQKVFWECLLGSSKAGVTLREIADATGFSRANVMYHLKKIQDNNPFFIGDANANRGKKK